jgi:hypothetical protein
MALEMTRSALAVCDTDAIRKREERLVKRLAAPRAGRLALGGAAPPDITSL